MKILHIIPSYYPATKYGGPIPAVHLLNKELVNQNVFIDVITTNAGLEARNDIPTGKWMIHDGVNVIYYKYYLSERYNVSPGLFYYLFFKIKKYDLVYISGVWDLPVIVGCCSAIFHNIKYIIMPHGSLCKTDFKIHSKYKKLLHYIFISQFYLKRITALRLTSFMEKCEIEKLFPKLKYFILPNGIDFNEYNIKFNEELFVKKFPLLKNKKYILFLSRINIKKGLDLLIRAFALFQNKYPNYILLIVGPDNENYGKTIKKLISLLHIDTNVMFFGNLTGNDKIMIYKNADLFILPSRSENFAMVVVEAMAAGVPILISNNIGISDDIKKYNAGIITDIKIDHIFKNMIKIIDNQNLKRTLINNGYKLINDKYDIVNVAKNMKQIFKNIILNKYYYNNSELNYVR